jgi:hypothetical protein
MSRPSNRASFISPMRSRLHSGHSSGIPDWHKGTLSNEWFLLQVHVVKVLHDIDLSVEEIIFLKGLDRFLKETLFWNVQSPSQAVLFAPRCNKMFQ